MVDRWQTIETAPKDGTEFLAWFQKLKLDENDDLTDEVVGGAMAITSFTGDSFNEPEWLNASGAYYFDDWSFAPDPVLWRSLPPEPGRRRSCRRHPPGDPMTYQATKLEPCPFCGGEPEILACSVHCNNPLCEAQPFTAGQSVPEAVAAWNRRALPPQAKAEPAGVSDEAQAAEQDPTWVLLSRPGMSAWRKGPFRDGKLVEQMLRDLYELYPDATCLVIHAPHTAYPEDGREWVAKFGDRRRRPIPPAARAILSAAPSTGVRKDDGGEG